MHRISLLRTWLLRLITWDGLLPITIWTAPSLVKLLLPNNRGAIEITAVALPVIAFVIRYYVGRRHIASNRCRKITRCVQLVAFCFGIFILVLLDAVVILTHVMPPQAKGDILIFLIIYSIYLPLMAIAMYPGLSKPQDELYQTWKRG